MPVTKETGAGIPGTSWADTAASPGPPAIMGSWRRIGILVHPQPSRGGDIAFPCHPSPRRSTKSYRATIASLVPQTHSGQPGLIVSVCAGLSARPLEQPSLIVTSKSAEGRSGTMFATQISSGQPSLNQCEEVPTNQITRPAEPARYNRFISAQSDRPSCVGRRGIFGLTEPEFCVCENDSQA